MDIPSSIGFVRDEHGAGVFLRNTRDFDVVVSVASICDDTGKLAEVGIAELKLDNKYLKEDLVKGVRDPIVLRKYITAKKIVNEDNPAAASNGEQIGSLDPWMTITDTVSLSYNQIALFARSYVMGSGLTGYPPRDLRVLLVTDGEAELARSGALSGNIEFGHNYVVLNISQHPDLERVCPKSGQVHDLLSKDVNGSLNSGQLAILIIRAVLAMGGLAAVPGQLSDQ